MKKILCALPILLLCWAMSGCVQEQPETDLASELFKDDLDALIARNEDFLGYARTENDKKVLQEEFLKLRLQYKKVEAFAEYFTPSTVRLVNGAPLDEVEDEENAVFEPGGLQVIEELVYTDEALDRAELVRHVRKMQVNCKRIKMLWVDIRVTDTHVFDALRLELFRLITLGISGFDTPASGNALAESKVVLESVGRYIAVYEKRFKDFDRLSKRIENSVRFVQKFKDFNSFDRAAFIVDHLNPLCQLLHDSQASAKIPFMKGQTLLRGDAATLFEKNAFDPEALVVNGKFASTADRAALGQKLFHDGRVSGNGRTNCGTCHQPALAYSDGLNTSKGFEGTSIRRNAPSVMYASLQQSLFYDLRSPSLEDQASDVIHNKDEMRGSLKEITRMIAGDADYRDMFAKAYPGTDTIVASNVQNALSVFIRTLNPFESPFDRYMRGDKKALTDNQVAGFNLFMGKARCGTCHFVPLFNGTVPPDYQRSESEVLGVTTHADWKHPRLDPDRGRGMFNRFPQWQHAFKTSSLRNIAKTAPYMHNGVLQSLEEVMEFYNEGGGAGLGLDVPNQTLAPDKLQLTPKEMRQVINFMEGLSDL